MNTLKIQRSNISIVFKGPVVKDMLGISSKIRDKLLLASPTTKKT